MLGKRHYVTATCEVRYSLAVPVELRQVVREVCKVKAGIKGKRHGTGLMRAIAAEADKAAKILILLPDDTKLEKWYSGFGFETKQTDPVLMIRNPRIQNG